MNILGRETYILQGKVGVNHCSQGYRGLARVCTESAPRGRPVRNFLDVNGTISRHKPTKLPSAVSKDDLLASHQQPCALKINVSQGCGGSLQHHVNNTEGICTAVFWCNREMSELYTPSWSLKLDRSLLATPNTSGLMPLWCWQLDMVPFSFSVAAVSQNSLVCWCVMDFVPGQVTCVHPLPKYTVSLQEVVSLIQHLRSNKNTYSMA